jgi:hypothetical protein
VTYLQIDYVTCVLLFSQQLSRNDKRIPETSLQNRNVNPTVVQTVHRSYLQRSVVTMTFAERSTVRNTPISTDPPRLSQNCVYTVILIATTRYESMKSNYTAVVGSRRVQRVS